MYPNALHVNILVDIVVKDISHPENPELEYIFGGRFCVLLHHTLEIITEGIRINWTGQVPHYSSGL